MLYGRVQLTRREYEAALRANARAIELNRTTSHRLVALAHSGHARQASATVPALLEQCPMFSIDYAERKLFYLKRPEQRTLYLDGLHAAGVPEQS